MTHTEILEKLGAAVKKGLGFDDTVFDSLEEALLEADAGAETSRALVEAVKARAGQVPDGDFAALRALLIEEIETLLARAPAVPAGGARPPLEAVSYTHLR